MREYFSTVISYRLFHLLRVAKHNDVVFRPYKYSGPEEALAFCPQLPGSP
jgi:hypothetical protein